MKKTLIYFLVPFIGLIIFGALYWNFDKTYEQKEAQKKLIEKQKKEEKLQKEANDRARAIKDAVDAQARRKAEKEARDKKDLQDREYRVNLAESRDKAAREEYKLKNQSERLQKDIDAEKAAIAKLDEQKRLALEEVAFLKKFTQQANANVQSLHDVIDKIAAADKARADAEAAAATAKKNNS